MAGSEHPPSNQVLILGDSLTYFGPAEAMPTDDPRLWPNRLGAEAHVYAGAGWTMRDAYWALTDNPSVWALLPRVHAVVLATGGMDMLPSPLPTFLRQGFRYLRNDRIRRTARTAYIAAQPALARLPGCPVALPPANSADYARRITLGIRALRPQLLILGMLPPLHRSHGHGFSLAGHQPQRASLRACFTELDVPYLDLCSLTARHVLDGHGNPDGMHWGWPGHELVANAVRDLLDRWSVTETNVAR